MSLAHKHYRNRPAASPARPQPHVPMGDERFRQLMSQLGSAFAQADNGEEKRQQAREREQRRQQWLAQREATIAEIIATLRRHGLTVQDLA